MNWIYEHLIKGVWPWYVGLIIFGLYWFIRYLYKITILSKWLMFDEIQYKNGKGYHNIEDWLLSRMNKFKSEK